MKIEEAIAWVREYCNFDSINSIGKAIGYCDLKIVIIGRKYLPKKYQEDFIKIVTARKNRVV